MGKHGLTEDIKQKGAESGYKKNIGTQFMKS